MKEMLPALKGCLVKWIEAETGFSLSEKAFRFARSGALSLSAFLHRDAAALCKMLNHALPRCVFEGFPLLQAVREEKGWLLFAFSPDFFQHLTDWARSLKGAPPNDYVSNRLLLLAQKGPCPCPDEERVKNALWLTLLCRETGRFKREAEAAVLTMTHGKTGAERLALEKSCGSVAAALYCLRSESKEGVE